ncbi:glycosyltransferase [Bacillus sp. WLY-B-L8]|uniref:glycosyltransferase n=1 Tax=Bacillus multifaciens TaxID=3068506 RepID=UPI0027425DDE|nr:glycosyltransferase [Bacillus sp. WLY-B-L8]MDP7978351.1 glycosyltransferase [Bacillus sp. WLY-B-L8]
MKTFVIYISEYGFGHATRCIALIREMLSVRKDIQIIVCHSFALDFIRESLKEYAGRVIFHDVETDVGYILKEHSLELDGETLQKVCKEFCTGLPEKIENEVAFLSSFQIECIVSDISPIAFEIAEKLAVPSIGISNFTWYTAYENILSQDLLQIFHYMYEKMDYFYSLAGNKEKYWAKEETFSFNFYSRRINALEVNRIQKELNPSGTKKIIFIPLGMKIDIGDITELSLWDYKEFVFIISSNMDVKHPNVHKIPDDYTESQNYVAVADCVVSKAGWGTVSEAVVYGKPLVIIDRKGMNEDQNTIRFLKNNQLCDLITWEELYSINPSEYVNVKKVLYGNEVSTIVSHILEIINKSVVNFIQKEGIM